MDLPGKHAKPEMGLMKCHDMPIIFKYLIEQRNSFEFTSFLVVLLLISRRSFCHQLLCFSFTVYVNKSRNAARDVIGKPQKMQRKLPVRML